MSKLRVNEITHKTGTGNIVVPTGNKIIGTDVGSMCAPGTVIQCKTARTTPATQTISSTTPQLITGLSVDITPIRSDSLMLIQAYVQGSFTYVSSLGIFKDGAATVSTAGFTNNNEPNMQATFYKDDSVASTAWVFPVMHYETSGNTSTRTYGVYATSGWSGTAYATYVNNRSSGDMASFSYMTVMEIAQ